MLPVLSTTQWLWSHSQSSRHQQPSLLLLPFKPSRPSRPQHQMQLGAVPPAAAATQAGWLIAAIVLAAARLARAHDDSRSFSPPQVDLREAWADHFEQQQLTAKVKRAAEQEATQRMEEARVQAERAEKERQADRKRLQDQQEHERKQAEAAMMEEKERIEAQQMALREEDRRRQSARRQEATRKAEERRAVEERQARLAEEDRKQREEQQARVAAAAQEREAQAREEAAAAAAALEALKLRFCLHLEGSLTASRQGPPQESFGIQTDSLQLTLQLAPGSSLSEGSSLDDLSPVSEVRRYASLEEASDQGLPGSLASASGRAFALRLEDCVGSHQEPGQELAVLKPAEAWHWGNLVHACVVLEATKAAVGAVGSLRDQAASRQLQIDVRRAILPKAHEQRQDTKLAQAARHLLAGQDEAARSLLEAVVQQEAFSYQELPQHACSALVVAWLVREAQEASMQLPQEGALALLHRLTSRAATDTLAPAADLVATVLGQSSPVAQEMLRLADTNASPAARQLRVSARQLRDARQAAALLEADLGQSSGEGGGPQAITRRKAAVPPAERIWALKNVAQTLALGGRSSWPRARDMLEEAVQLKQQLLGAARHPGLLPEWQALLELLQREPSWQAEARSLASQILQAHITVADRYTSCGELLSSIALLEAAVKAQEQVLGFRDPTICAASRKAENLLSALTSQERQQVVAARRREGTTAQVNQAFEEEIAARRSGAPSAPKHQLWQAGGLQPLPERLV